jgi:flavodoxin
MPEIEAIPDNLDSCDVIFVGTPIWWHTMAPPVFTFLSHADLSGKTVVPFCTHGGGGKGQYINDVAKLCKNSIILDELVVYGNGGESAKTDVLACMSRVGIGENA